MKVTLMGPDDEGRWVLADSKGNDFPLVEKWDDHPAAAKLLGWVPSQPDEEQSDEMIEEAQEFLMEHSGDDFKAPLHVAQFFEQGDK